MDTEIISIHISKNKKISILVTSLTVLAVSLLLWWNQALDNQIVISQNFIFENDLYLNTAQIISRYGMGFIAFLYGILALLTFRFKQLESLRPLFVLIIFSFGFGSISGDILKILINRARPIVELAGQIASTNLKGSPAFPSGHATKSMALALPFVLIATGKDFITRLVKILALTSAVLVCYSRIALQRHYLSDVLAGLGIALLFVVIGIWIVNLFYEKKRIGHVMLTTLSKRLAFVLFALAVLLSIG